MMKSKTIHTISRQCAICVALLVCLAAMLGCRESIVTKKLPVHGIEFSINPNKAFGLSIATSTFSDSNVYGGILRSIDGYICQSCNTDTTHQEKYSYLWVYGRSPQSIEITGNTVTIVCSKEINEDAYYIFDIEKNMLPKDPIIKVLPD